MLDSLVIDRAAVGMIPIESKVPHAVSTGPGLAGLIALLALRPVAEAA